MDISQAKRLKDLEKENQWLKKLVANQPYTTKVGLQRFRTAAYAVPHDQDAGDIRRR